jgi:D-mannonate dehydratase
MNRRQFVSTVGMAAVMAHGTLLPTMAADQVGSPSQRSIMKVGTQQGPVTDAMLRFFMIMPDHMPTHADDPESLQAFAFGYGYIKALIQSVARKSPGGGGRL